MIRWIGKSNLNAAIFTSVGIAMMLAVVYLW